MWKRALGSLGIVAVVLSFGSGCRFWCERYCEREWDRYDRYERRRGGDCNDPCRGSPPPVRYDDCR